jgi:threonine/homoserine/homoserine lactone efflux protein
MLLILKSLAFAFLITVPLGPMGFLIVREMYFGVRWRWIWFALGMTASDLFYSSVILLNLHYIQRVLHKFQTPLEILSGTVLITLGLTALYKLKKVASKNISLLDSNDKVTSDVKIPDHTDYVSVERLEAFMTAFISCLGNVSQLATFTLLFTSLHLSFALEYSNAIHPIARFAFALLVGTAFTWLLVYAIVKRIPKSKDPKVLIEKGSAWVIAISGVFLMLMPLVK